MSSRSVMADVRRLKLLVLSELDGQILRVNRLCERLVSSFDGGDIDAILVSGGFVAARAPREYEALEAVAAAEGDMMALVSRLEMIVCRVLYIPDDNDPPTTRSLVVAPPTLTQYSSNVYSRTQQLADGVVVMGEAHYFNLINDSKDPTDGHDLVLVLRDSAARTPLPAHGSFRLGQFTILELEKHDADDSTRTSPPFSHDTRGRDQLWRMGGDDFASWAPLSQSQTSQTSQTSQASQASQASSKSVDLAALNSLRVLVRYEFENAPVTTDELIEALGACHNNTLEASHYLRSKRRLEAVSSVGATGFVSTSSSDNSSNTMATALVSNKRRQDADSDDDEVQIVDNPNKRLRENTPPSSQQAAARSLRLHSSQDAEMASPPASSSSSQQHELNGSVAPPNTQHAPHDDDVNSSAVSSQCGLSQEMTDGVEQQHVDEPMAMADAAPNAARARQLIDDAVHLRRINCDADTDDAHWISSVWDALGVTSTPEVAQQLDQTCAVLAAWLDEVDTQDFVAAQKGLALDVVLEIVSALPRADDSGDLVEHVPLEAPDNERQSDADVAALAHALQHPDPNLNAHARSVAAEAAIKQLTSICTTRIERIVWFADARAANAAHQRSVQTQLQQLHARLATMCDRCSADVRTSESAVTDARCAHATRAQQLLDFVRTRRTELLARGATKVGAKAQAMIDVVASNDIEIAALRGSCVESDRKIAQCAMNSRKYQRELAFAQRAMALLAKVRDRREWFARSALQSFDDARSASDVRATGALVRCIPVLTTALQQYYEFHSICQARANAEANEKRRELERHVEYFGDSAPINKEEIERRIREYVGVISRSTQLMLQITESQNRVWSAYKDALPRVVKDALVAEFGKLWTQLSGPARDAMQSVVTQYQGSSESGVGAAGAGRSDRANSVHEPLPICTTTTSPSRPAPPPTAPTDAPAVAASMTTYSAVTLVDESPPPRARSARSSLSSGTTGLRSVTSGVVKTLVTSVQASPVRVENLSMTQEVETFLRHAEPVSALFTRVSGAETAPRTASSPLRTPDVAAASGSVATAASTHEFPLGTVVYTKFDVDKDAAQFVRGRVDKLLDDGHYSVLYDDGDVFTVAREYIFTQEDMEKDLKLQERKRSDTAPTADGASGAQDASDGTCAIM